MNAGAFEKEQILKELKKENIVDLKEQEKKQKLLLPTISISLLSLFLFILFIVYENFIKKPVFLTPFIGKVENSKITKKNSYNPKVIGFLPSWQVAKKVVVYPENLTELIYFSIPVLENGDLVLINENNGKTLEWIYFNSNYFQQVKKQCQDMGVKVSVSITCFDNVGIDSLISNNVYTQNFINKLLNLINDEKLDGINIDFEYLPETDFPTRKYFNEFIEKVSTILKKQHPDLNVSVDIFANAAFYDTPFDLKTVSKYVDEIIVMGYDFHRASSTISGPVAPLRGKENEKNITDTLKSIYSKVESEKIVLGLPFYGYEWQTVDKNHKSPTYPKSGALATYKRVQEIINSEENAELFWDRNSLTPYLVYEPSGITSQIYFENDKSIAFKLQLVRQLKIGGIAIWALGYEGNNMDLWEVINNF